MRLDTPAPRAERRRYRRRPAIRNTSRLSWDTPSGWIVSRVTLIDVSEGGVLLEATTSPPVGQHVSIIIDEPVRAESSPATVVRQGPSRQVALGFCRTPAYDFFLAATVGIDLLQSLFVLPDEERFSADS